MRPAASRRLIGSGAKHEAYEQRKDERGLTRLDWPFTPEEAKEQDARNRERLEKGRTGRFDACFTGEEQHARAKRGRSKR